MGLDRFFCSAWDHRFGGLAWREQETTGKGILVGFPYHGALSDVAVVYGDFGGDLVWGNLRCYAHRL